MENKEQFVLNLQPKTGEHLIGQTCNICGDEVGLTTEGELFEACNECAFPICRVCYDYERKEGNQTCPRCKTRFKRLKGHFSRPFHLFILHCFSENGFIIFQAVLEWKEMKKKMALMT